MEDIKEEYITEDAIVKNDIYKSLKEDIICSICEKLMIMPMECTVCQNQYCQKCIENWKKKGGGCPNHCEGAELKKVIQKKRLISKITFRCILGCGAEILFDELKNHYSIECLTKKKTMKHISKEEIKEHKLKKKIGKIPSFTRK